MRRTPLLAALLLLGVPGPPLPAAAQGTTDATPTPGHRSAQGLDAADSLVAAWVSEGRIPGAVLLVLHHGEPVLEKAYGHARLMEYARGEYGASQAGEERPDALRRLDAPVPMTTATVFDLASVTKVMATTLAVMLLADRGALDLDAPVFRHLPDFRGGGKEAITPRHLLSHTSGLQPWVPTYYHAADADGAYAYVRDLPPGRDPGEERRYSDLGFMVLGRLVEEVAGRPLDRFLADELYRPLGLVDIGFRRRGAAGDAAGRPGEPTGPFAATSHGNPYEHRMVHDSAFGYRIPGDPHRWDGWRRHTLVGQVNDGNAWHGWGGVAGHAGLLSTARDLGVLLQLLLDGGESQGRRWLRPETIETFLTPVVEGQALGWQLPAYAPAGSFAHTGFTGTWVLGVPARRMAVVLLTNRQNGGVDGRGLYPDLGPLQRSVAAALLGGGAGTGGGGLEGWGRPSPTRDHPAVPPWHALR